MTPVKINYKVYQGSTFSKVLRRESSNLVYKSITGITQAAPAIVTSVAHGLPQGWRFKITSVIGMTEINSSDTYHQAVVLSNDTVELNKVNSILYKAYTSGGIIEYNQPIDLTGYTARMQIREKLDSDTVIKELTTENGGIIINTSNYTITIYISASDTAAFTFKTAEYSLELIHGSEVYPLSYGTLTLQKEVTR